MSTASTDVVVHQDGQSFGSTAPPRQALNSVIRMGPIRIGVADSPELLHQAYRLVHDVYVRCGYIMPQPNGMRMTRFDALPETTTFVACLEETVVATLTLVPDSSLGLPMQEIYGEELQAFRGQGRRLAEVTSLADRRKDPRRGMAVFMGLTKLMIHTARERQIDDLLVAVHPKHARFYQRVLVFERFGSERSYPSVRNNPAVALRLDLKSVKENEQLSRRVLTRYFGADSESVGPRRREPARA